MKKAPKIKDDHVRIAALNGLRVLDTESEEQFDSITELAASLTGCPISLISLIDEDRQWFKSHYGLDATETPRDISYCGHAIVQDDIFIVNDATNDVRFKDNPLCVEAPHVVFYAGVPLKLSNGHNIGTLCVIDHESKKLSENQLHQLRLLAKQVVTLMDLRLRRIQNLEMLKTIKVGSFSLNVTTGEKVHSGSMFEIFPDLKKLKKPTLQSLVHFDDLKRLTQTREAAIETGVKYEITYRIVEGSKEITWVKERGEPVKNRAGKVVSLNGICQDISSLKEKEIELHNTNTYLQLALEGGEIGIWDWFIDEDRVVFDQGWANILGLDYDSMKMEFSTWQERVHPDDLGKCFQAINDYLEGKTDSYEIIHRMRHVSGKWVYAQGKAKISARDKDGKPTRLTGTQVDMTEVVERELENADVTQKLQRTEETAKIGSWSIDLNTGKPWLSDETYRIYGLEVGSPFETEKGISFYHPDDQPRIIKYVNDAIEKQIPYNDVFRFITAKNENIWVRATGNYYEDKEKGIKRLEGSFQDITEQKQAEIAKDEFLSVVSHEIRTPLTSIIGLSEVLSETKLDEESLESVKSIHSAGHTVLTLINDVLDLSKLRSERLSLIPTEGNLEIFINETMKLLQVNASSKGIGFESDVNLSNPYVRCDFIRLRQVIVNVLSNAIKFTDDGGVQFSVHESSPGTYYFEVRDSGCGISEDFLPKIFNVFEQDHNSDKVHAGTGLGMNISQQIIKLMESDINVESQLGLGSKFSFSLNLEVLNQSEISKITFQDGSHLDLSDNILAGKVLLYADDNKMNQKVVSKMLAKTGVILKTFDNGQEILDHVRSSEKADFILMDIQMPALSGYDATKAIREFEEQNNIGQVPIIAFSAFSFEKDIEKALDAGCSDHIAKPIKKAVLIEKLDSWVRIKKAS